MFYKTLLLSVLLKSFTVGDPHPRQAQSHHEGSTPVNKTLILELVNKARRKGTNCGGTYMPPAPPLEWDNQLEKAARAHSRDMASSNYFSHSSSDGEDPGSRIKEAGYNWRNYGENIGMGYRTEQEVVEGWLHSPGHCRNIMNRTFRHMGVGREGTFWTQDFGNK